MTCSSNRLDPPADLAALIRLAMADAEKLDPEAYEPYSSVWHKLDERCEVCFAGAVMAVTLDARINGEYEPGDFSPAWTRALYALEHVRCAQWLRLANNGWLTSAESVVLSSEFECSPDGLFVSWDQFDEFLKWAGKAADRIESLRADQQPAS